ncbi:S9 family peptidase [Brevibacterium litoralis]|uniref:S9 family peptidase n=1 Tax=Brevibacterium litoralis TaxID=3138935 RepID=UPI0032ECDDA2
MTKESPQNPSSDGTNGANGDNGTDADATPTPVTTLLDATRFGGLAASRSGGPLYATAQMLDAKGTAYVNRLVEIGEDSVQELTRGKASVGGVTVGADGTLVFTSARPGDDGEDATDAALWTLPTRGEARRIATRTGGFGRVELAGAHSEVLVAEVGVHTAATDEESHTELAQERKDSKVSAILHTGFPVRRWDHDLGPARQTLAVARAEAGTRVVDLAEDDLAEDDLQFSHVPMPTGRLIGWSVAPDGTFALVTVEIPIAEDLEASPVWRVDLTAAAAAPVLLIDADAEYGYSAGDISPDGTRVLVDRHRAWTPETSLRADLFLLDLGGDTGAAALQPVWPEGDFWYSATWLDDSTLVATSDDTGRGSVWTGAPTDAAPTRLAGGPEQKFAFSGLVVSGGRVFASASAVDVPPFPVEISPADGDVSPLANPGTDLAAPGVLREVVAEGEDGTRVRAWLRVPEGDGPHPLLVMVHGGPWGSWNSWTYRWNPNPFVAAGYAVLLPDPAISTGYGQAMIDRGQQELGGAPFTDLMALVDATVAQPFIDEDRTALAGGSYGGYMANWVAGHTGARFRTIVTHASLWNVTSMGRTTDNSSWDQAMRLQAPEYSPHHYADRIEVPLLVIHGDKDYRVPIGQGQELWYDLLTRSATPLGEDGRTQHAFLYYPDEGHWILGRGNAQVWYETVLGWLDTHVHGTDWDRPATLG